MNPKTKLLTNPPPKEGPLDRVDSSNRKLTRDNRKFVTHFAGTFEILLELQALTSLNRSGRVVWLQRRVALKLGGTRGRSPGVHRNAARAQIPPPANHMAAQHPGLETRR
jgi:hypothetical protein